MKFTQVISVGLIGLLVGCGSIPSSLELAEQQADIERLREEHRQERVEREQQRMTDELKQVPEWLVEPPKSDTTGFYGVGASVSSQYSMALRKARMLAEFELAKQYQQELSGSERLFVKEGVNGDIKEQTSVLIDKLVADVSLVGYDTVKQTIVPIDGKYHSFVLLKLPYDEFNAVLKQRQMASEDATIQAAFDELQLRLEDKRQRELDMQQRAASKVVAQLEAQAEIPAVNAPDRERVKTTQQKESKSPLAKYLEAF